MVSGLLFEEINLCIIVEFGIPCRKEGFRLSFLPSCLHKDSLFYCFLLILFPQRSRSVIIQILDHLLCPTDAYEYRFPHPYFFFLLRPGKLYLNSVFNFDNYVIYVNSTLSTYSYLKGISYCVLSVI